MDVMAIIVVVIVVSAVAALLGAGLATAAQKFAVKENPKVSAVEEVLPGINCGACGFPGCSGYAEAVALDPDVPTNLCTPGGGKVSAQIAEVTGKAAGSSQKRVALLRCTQDMRTGAPQKYEYEGIQDCASIAAMHKGLFTCPFACVGAGNCERVCPVDAIKMVNGRPVIDPRRCTGCGICAKICPRDVLELAPYPGRVQVYCRNTYPPAAKRKMCPSACIGCSICAKNCPHGAVTMVDKVGVVDHSKCPPDCPRPCIDKCPTGAILATGMDAKERNKPLLKKHEHLLEPKKETEEKELEKTPEKVGA
jgi:Na+-translocating ferredoxin:NAD+ oxidoreductase subunit B